MTIPSGPNHWMRVGGENNGVGGGGGFCEFYLQELFQVLTVNKLKKKKKNPLVLPAWGGEK